VGVSQSRALSAFVADLAAVLQERRYFMTKGPRLDRIQQRPDPEHWNDDELLSLGEAAALYWAWHVDVTDAALSADTNSITA
jgi:hypothetical protein